MNLELTKKPAKSWSRRKQARPDEILDAALEVFAEKGFAAARMEDIAKRAGVTKGTIYLYFPSKEEVFKSLARKHVGDTITSAAEQARLYEGSLRDFLAMLFAIVGEKIHARPRRGSAENHHRRERQFPGAGALLAHRSDRQGARHAVRRHCQGHRARRAARSVRRSMWRASASRRC